VETESDAKVKSVKSTLRFRYDSPQRIDWEQERGEVKSLHGWWQFEDLGDGRTRATYGLDVDPGRMLGLLLRGPVQDTVMSFLLGNAAEGLKGRAEG
jgi:ribosome-associated toxin RatA of RatAB toxin-antitoxin module